MKPIAFHALLLCAAFGLHAGEANDDFPEANPAHAGQTVQTKNAAGGGVDLVYDSKGRVISKIVRDKVGKESKWNYFYDEQGRLVQLLKPDQSRTLYLYADEKSKKPDRVKLIGPDGREQSVL